MKNTKVQIDLELFILIALYFENYISREDEEYKLIIDGIQRKLDSMSRHNDYTQYKSGETEDLRDTARKRYLEKAGIPLNYRWNAKQDWNFST